MKNSVIRIESAQFSGTANNITTTNIALTGTVDLNITSIALSGSNPGDFSQTNDCGSIVSAGNSCTFTVTFAPGAVGSRSAASRFSRHPGRPATPARGMSNSRATAVGNK